MLAKDFVDIKQNLMIHSKMISIGWKGFVFTKQLVVLLGAQHENTVTIFGKIPEKQLGAIIQSRL